jgi:CheY-like chemotaxis protein
MAHKSALIVDDSRTARRFLAQVLEQHDMRVETAESAEQALEFLSHDRPDVIFMDHMMPGMDGFQAVRAIKNNPATATIPIMMYTSQAGELYVSQARALGAVGVLPKQIKPVEITALLESLHLLPGGEIERDAAPAAGGTTGRVLQPADWEELHRWLGDMLRNNRLSLRSDIEGAVARLLDERLAPATDALQEDTVSVESVAGPGGRRGMTAGAFLVLALAGLAAVFLWLHLDTQKKWRQATAQNAELLAALEARRDDASADTVDARATLDAERARLTGRYSELLGALEWGINQASEYGPGQTPLGDERLDLVAGLLERLRNIGFTGEVRITVHAGEFCLVPGPDGGLQLAPDDWPASSCATLGAPAAADGLQAELQSVAFANWRADMQRPGGRIRVVVDDMGARAPLYPYPSSPMSATASDWNSAALRNNRVSVRLSPDGDLPATARADASTP